MLKRFHIHGLLLGICLAVVYANHFHNTFHFDDSHTIVNNLYIRDLKQIPRFFTDATTFSSLPTNQSYRPILTTTLAFDYWLGGGLKPFYFHLTTFIIFLFQGICLLYFFRHLLERSGIQNTEWVTSGITLWYMIHPANAETINYVIARGDVLSTACVVFAFVLYVKSPLSKKYFLYLIPVVVGTLTKISAVMFAPLLMLYVLLFERDQSQTPFSLKTVRSNFASAIKTTLPAFLTCGLLFFLIQTMEPNWSPGGSSRYHYLITQPYVIFHYAKTLIAPLWLSADTDWTVFDSILNLKAIFGFLACFAVIWVAYQNAQTKQTRPITFGICWFFITLLPTSSIIPLAEVMNDHRIFFPYIGLTLAAGWWLYLVFEKYALSSKIRISLCLILLTTYAYGTFQRNQVWKSDESLWRDVTLKSPKNGRGWMNYGLVHMANARYAEAETCFMNALKLAPNYSYLHTNMGILKSAMNSPKEAEHYFQNALSFGGHLPEPHFYYAQFLHQHNQDTRAILELVKTLELSPGHALADSLLKSLSTTPENFLNLSFAYYKIGKYKESIQASQEALRLKPNYDLAYNNLCSAYNQLGEWDLAIEAGEKAVELNPTNHLAKNNLAWAKSQKAKRN